MQNIPLPKKVAVDDFVFNEDWDLDTFDTLDFGKRSEYEKFLFSVVRNLKVQNLKISAVNVFKEAKKTDPALATKILLAYMKIDIGIDYFKFKTKIPSPSSSSHKQPAPSHSPASQP